MLSEDQAKEICRAEAERRGWDWKGKIRVEAHLRFFFVGRVTSYEVISNTGYKGCNAKFFIDAESGEVLKAYFLSR